MQVSRRVQRFLSQGWLQRFSKDEIDQEIAITRWRYPDLPNPKDRAIKNLMYRAYREDRTLYNHKKKCSIRNEHRDPEYPVVEEPLMERLDWLEDPPYQILIPLSGFDRLLVMFLADYTVPEVATILFMSEDMVYRHLEKIRKKLIALLPDIQNSLGRS